MLVLAVPLAAMLSATPSFSVPNSLRSEPVDLVCRDPSCLPAPSLSDSFPTTSTTLGKRSFLLPPLGEVAPAGWLLNQLVVQANGLSGYMASSTFPGAINVNQSMWLGGNYKTSTLQWLPYWTNGNVPLVELIRAAGAEGLLDPGANLPTVIDAYVDYILTHTNKSSGWIGPFMNEPGDINGHGLWDPLNMLRTLLNYGQAHTDKMAVIAKACVAHMTKESVLLKTDPVYKWAQTRWPTFVEIALYIIDEFVPLFGSDPDIMPLGADGTVTMLLNASMLFAQKGMDWHAYYHRTGAVKFPFGPVPNWNTNDHGVNNAEGALRYPAVSYRMQNNASYKEEMNYVLGMLDKYQGQVQALFCADEVFCGREPHRGTETCAVVEAMASLEYAFTTLGDPLLMDRVERLAFNAMPAALTADMWTHVYVQQPNSVFAGNTHPSKATEDAILDDGLDSGGCARCGGYRESPDTPSGEDMGANFYGVSHFPCCITNFPQGWPKFAMHAVVAEADHTGIVVASLVPSKSNISSVGALVVVDSTYPFSSTATIKVTTEKLITTKVRIPGWAVGATLNGKAAANGTLVAVACKSGTNTIEVNLNTQPRLEIGWGGFGKPSASSVNYTSDGPAMVPSSDDDLDFAGGAAYEAQTRNKSASVHGIRSGNPNSNSSVSMVHPLVGEGHYIESIQLSFMYTAGYTPAKGQVKKAATVEVALFDYLNGDKVASIYQSPPLGNYSYDDFKGYSPPILVNTNGLRIDNSRPLQLRLNFVNNDRNIEMAFENDLGIRVGWSSAISPNPIVPVPPNQLAPDNSAAVLYGPLVMAHHPQELVSVKTTYVSDLPARPKAVDYEISTNETWNYAIDLNVAPKFVKEASSGWSLDLPFSTSDYPFYVSVEARQLSAWGFWDGSKITDSPPSSPINCTEIGCGPLTTLKLVPLGGTNIRISVFPWLKSPTKIHSSTNQK